LIIVTIYIVTNSSAISSTKPVNDEQDFLQISSIKQQNIAIDNFNLPIYWNWRDMNGTDWTTPAKNQGRCSSCIIFGIVGALESIIKIREGCADFNPDLSEQYVMSCIFMKNLFSVTPFYERINGTVFESSFPYNARFLIPCSHKSSNWKKYFVPSSSFYIISGVTREFIKNKLIEHGPVVIPIYAPGWSRFSNGLIGIWGRIHRNSDDYCSLKVPKFPFRYSNHWIIIVGWKDDPFIENGGYWICKNCWGSNWGYNGFFNLEYGSLNSDSGYIGWIDYTPEDFNWPPIGSPRLNGPIYMEANVEYEFNFSSVDPEGDPVYYKFYWDDGSQSDWLGPFESGGIVTIKHIWNRSGSYNVKVIAKNENGSESDQMPNNKFKMKNSPASHILPQFSLFKLFLIL